MLRETADPYITPCITARSRSAVIGALLRHAANTVSAVFILNIGMLTNAAEIGHLYQLCSLIRICTISYLANDIGKAIIIIMFKLKNKNDNHLLILPWLFTSIFDDCRRYFDRTAHEKFLSISFLL